MNKHKQKKSHPFWRPLLPTQNPGRGTLWDFPPLQNTIGTSAIHHRGFQINWKRRPKSKEQRVGKTWNKEVKRRFWQNVAGSTCHVALRQNGSDYILFFFKKFISHFTSWLGKTSIKKTFSFRHCPNKGGGLPMPEFFGPLSKSAFLVNKKSLFLQKCQCIELLTVF